MRLWVGSIPGLTQWVKDLALLEWCRLQTLLRSFVAVAVVYAGSCSSNSTPSLGTYICLGCGPKKSTHTHTHTKKRNNQLTSISEAHNPKSHGIFIRV